jgi:hypothetical protein
VSGVDVESVLAAHVDVGGMFSEEHGYQKYVCLCGEGSSDYRWHRAHVAAVLNEQIVAAQAEAWDAGWTAAAWRSYKRTDIAIDDDGPNPYRAARVAPSRVGGECDPNHPEGVDCDGYPLGPGERCGRDEHATYRVGGES